MFCFLISFQSTGLTFLNFLLFLRTFFSCGKSSKATNGGGTSELVEDGVTGYLVRRGDVYQLAEKILFLLDHQDICLRMGAEGEKRIIEDFNFKKMINTFQDEYKKILKN